MIGRPSANVELRPYYRASDASEAVALWNAALGNTWPQSEETFRLRTHQGIVATSNGRMGGLVLTQTGPGLQGIQALVVTPNMQRQGIGAMLEEAGIELLRRAGAERIRLGGVRDYLWPGVPDDLPQALRFCRRRGWEFTHTTWDLLRHLGDYQTPPEITERGREAGCIYRPGEPRDMDEILRFEQDLFPAWLPYFKAAPRPGGIVVAIDRESSIVGTLLAELPQDRPATWSAMLGWDAGEIGAVGVSPRVEGRGIGTALVARACKLMRDAGVGNCHIRWTNRLSFYGRLGFEPWREYHVSSRDV